MQARQRRIDLLHRLGRMREVEKQGAAMRVAEAHGAHSKLLNLRERSDEIAAGYARRNDAGTGAELAGQLGFLTGLDAITRQTEVERRKAMLSSEAAMQGLVLADRKLELTGDRLTAAKRAASRDLQSRESSSNPVLARNLARKLNSR